MYCTSLQGNTYVMNHFHLNKENTFIYLIMFNWKSQLPKLCHSPSFSYAFQCSKITPILQNFISSAHSHQLIKKSYPQSAKKA